MVERELPKLLTAVRFRSPALHQRGFGDECIRGLVACALLVGVAACTPYPGKYGGVAAPETVIPRTGVSETRHRVRRGETLWSISQRYGVSMKELARLNRLGDGSRLEAGRELRVPGTARAAAPGKPERLARLQGFAWPVQGRVISIFGTRRNGRVNKGVDILAAPGTEVHASRSGTVSFTHETMPGFGKTIILEHGNEYASVYARLGEILVRAGDSVTQRQMIARVGRSALGDGSGVHFEIRWRQKAQNPLHYLP